MCIESQNINLICWETPRSEGEWATSMGNSPFLFVKSCKHGLHGLDSHSLADLFLWAARLLPNSWSAQPRLKNYNGIWQFGGLRHNPCPTDLQAPLAKACCRNRSLALFFCLHGCLAVWLSLSLTNLLKYIWMYLYICLDNISHMLVRMLV